MTRISRKAIEFLVAQKRQHWADDYRGTVESETALFEKEMEEDRSKAFAVLKAKNFEIAEDGSHINEGDVVGLGVMSRRDGEAWLNSLYVNPHFRGGLGTWLLGYLERTALEDQAETVKLEVRLSNKKAIHVYEKAGYKKIEERLHKDYIGKHEKHAGLGKGKNCGCEWSTIMQKELPPTVILYSRANMGYILCIERKEKNRTVLIPLKRAEAPARV